MEEVTITWTVEDIQEAARRHDGSIINDDKAEEILKGMASGIQDSCIEEGWYLIEGWIGDFLNE